MKISITGSLLVGCKILFLGHRRVQAQPCQAQANAADTCVQSLFSNNLDAGNACVECANNVFTGGPPACSQAENACRQIKNCDCGACLDTVAEIGYCLWEVFTDCSPLDCSSVFSGK